jgi:Fe-Mn family superoxide dismutase
MRTSTEFPIMTISLMPIHFAEDALEPHISAETLKTHHDAHHKAYVDKVNKAIEATPLDAADLETIVMAAKEHGNAKLFNSAAQAWNHGFYWNSLTPAAAAPATGLADAIRRDFGSAKALGDALIEEGSGHFASGWTWLVIRDGKLKVISTHDAGTALTEAVIPLLTIDVWEHAYYLDVKSKRPDHLKAVVENCLNWKFASENYDRSAVWTYPQPVLSEHDA